MSTRCLLIITLALSAAVPATAQSGAAEQLAVLGATTPDREARQITAKRSDGQAAPTAVDAPTGGAEASTTKAVLLNAARWGATGGAIGAGVATLVAGAWVIAGGALVMRSVGCCSGPAPGLNVMMMATPLVGLVVLALPAAVTGLALFSADAGLGAIIAGALGASAVFVLMLPVVALSTVLMATTTTQHFGGGANANGYGLSGRQLGSSALVLMATSAGAAAVSGVLTAGVAAAGALLDVGLEPKTQAADRRPSELE